MDSKKNNGSFKQFVEKILNVDGRIKYSVLVICGLIIGFLIHFYCNRPNFGVFVSSDMDPTGNVYVLGVDSRKNQYRVSKISPNGNVAYQINLDNPGGRYPYYYNQIKADYKGNFYVVQQSRDTEAIVTNESKYPIGHEAVLMYDTNGNYLKQVAKVDFTEDPAPPTLPYIVKVQTVNDEMRIVGRNKNVYDVITAKPLESTSPEKLLSFEIKPPVDQSNMEWVNDIAVLSNGRVIYSTQRGNFYAMDNQKTFLDYTNVVSRNETSLVDFYVDDTDNLYFTDALSGDFYRLNTRSISAESLYKLDTGIANSGNIKLSDIRKVQVIANNDYYGVSKDFNNPYHVRFGSMESVMTNIRGALIPWGLLIMIVTVLVLIGLEYAIRYMINFEIKRIPLFVKITVLFLPLFIVVMVSLLYINTRDAVNEYTTILREDQDTGAKIVAGHIDGDAFCGVNHVSGYLTNDYINLKNSVQKGYDDLADKIGDRSDYIVTYIVKNNKIYSTLTNKYSVASASYPELKYANVDMVPSRTTLIDYVLESDERDSIYAIWDSMKENTTGDLVYRATFRDVHGDINASFVAIKDSEKLPVGFVGNFLDEQIHYDNQFNKILRHSLAIVILVSVVIFGYLCYIVIRCLRPLKSIEKAVNTMSRGEWETRIEVQSKDEFADIVEAFNNMSEKIGRYTSNLVKLNEEYIRYVPKEFFKLIGKDNITKIDLFDYKVIDMNILYLRFNLSCKGSYDFNSEEELFDILNNSYDEFFKLVEKNNGLVQSFSGAGATILFPDSPEDAFNTAAQFKEVFLDDSIRNNMHIVLGAGKVLIGISGNQSRRGVIVVSDDVMQIFNIQSQLKNIGINQVATKDIISKLPPELKGSYRFIGKVGDIADGEPIDLYELIDSTNKYKKDLYISTKELLAKGIELYSEQNFQKAKKIFFDVLKINEKDPISSFYLMKCDEQLMQKENNYSGKKWNSHLFD